ncbi:lipid-A-disaccharide synthase [Synechococcus sp. RSCCF101]|uniref:lipid-A-disaccharide synthase n=1 Tax=Synechococcus sp. RSCCF101 TaxID=2511069 RepID=UPI00124748F7|nr:lipid-A-disaccharide synthase [Synechococcus sp. RSCCF101]QEY33177.1 lipid-A-disaccharide synthase [Synechococcus sp. RSCCF101]
MVRLLISTGEVSGDLQGSLLIQALHRRAAARGVELEVHALGGPRMERAGATLLADTAPMGAIGLWEALPLVLPTLKLQRRVDAWLRRTPPDGVVMIDYMGANVSLGRRLRRRHPDLPILYYIAPQEWAFRLGEGGTTRLLGFTDLILAVFPEEARFYAERGASVSWVGHPLLDTVRDGPDRQQARRELGLADDERLLLLLPASRQQELAYLMPAMAEAAARLQARHPKLRVILSASMERFEAPLQRMIGAAGLRARMIGADQADAMKPVLFAAADLALTKSGTVNLELALRDVPQVVGYRLSRITAFVARWLLRFNVAHISPVNLLLHERLLPELLQDEYTVERLVDEAERLLNDGLPRQQVLDGYARLRGVLGDPGVTDRAADAVLDRLVPAARATLPA